MRKLITYFILLTSSLSAQNLDILVEEGDRLFTATNKNLVFPINSIGYQNLIFFSPLDSSRNSHYLELQLLELEKKQFRQDIGLQFKASANYNFRDVINEETNNFNLGTIRAELEWNVLKSGYTNNRVKGRIKENQFQIQSNRLTRNERVLQRRKFRIDYTYAINKEKLKLLEKHLVFQNHHFDYLNKLYYQKYVKREILIKASNEISILETEIKNLVKENLILKDSVSEIYLNSEDLPILKLNIDSLNLEDKFSLSNFDLESENIKLSHKAINDLSLSFYVQENYNYSRVAHRFFPSVGFRFKAPIRFNKRKKIIDTKIKIMNAQLQDKSVGRNNRFITTIKTYNEKLKDLKNQYKSWKIIEERSRILSLLKSEIETKNTGIHLLELTNEKFKVLANVIQLKRQLYTILSQILEMANWKSIEEVTSIFQYEKEKQLNKQFFISDHHIISYKTQLNYYLLNQNTIELMVKKEDLEIQNKLNKQGIKYTIMLNGTMSLASEILRSANQLNIKL